MKEKPLTLTKSEIQVMNVLWSAGRDCDVHCIVAAYPEPRPAYTTISTFLKILEKKGFVAYRKGNGKQHLYYPLVSKAQYTARVMQDVKDSFFDGDPSSLIRFFAREERLSEEELAELLQSIEQSELAQEQL